MKRKKIFYFVVIIVFSFILGEIIFNDFKRNLDDSKYNAYLIQIGSFKDDNEVDPSKYLVLKENGRYNVYAGITSKLSNASKIKRIYEDEDIESVIKPTIIDNVEFISSLEQFDILMSEVDNKDSLLSINDVIISKYEELILENNKN